MIVLVDNKEIEEVSYQVGLVKLAHTKGIKIYVRKDFNNRI